MSLHTSVPSASAASLAAERSAAHFDLASLTPPQLDVLQALSLGALHRPRTWVMELLAELGWRDLEGRRYTQDGVRALMHRLAEMGWLSEHSQQPGYWQVHPQAYGPVYSSTLDRVPYETLNPLLAAHEGVMQHGRNSTYWRFPNRLAACAVVRLALYSGRPPAEVRAYKAACEWGMSWEEVSGRALDAPIDAALFARLHVGVQTDVLHAEFTALHQHWRPVTHLPLLRLAEDLLGRTAEHDDIRGAVDTSGLALDVAQHYLLSGRFDDIDDLLATHPDADTTAWLGVPGGMAVIEGAISAIRLYRQGRWEACVDAYEAVHNVAKVLTGKRKMLLPLMLAWPYALALMAQQTPAHWQKALKFCLAEGGKKTPINDNAWGAIALALQMRLGEAARDVSIFQPHSRAPHPYTLDFWSWHLRAWLADGSDRKPVELPIDHLRAADFLRNRLTQAGLHDLSAQMEAALAGVQGKPVPPWFFVTTVEEGWRSTLAALAAIGTPEPAPRNVATGNGEARLVWVIELEDDGGISHISPQEQRLGSRGWSKAKDITLAKISKLETLPPWDAAVARTIRTTSYDRTLRLDLAATAAALVGHPCVEFDDLPGVPVTLVESAPEIDVLDQGDSLLVRLQPLPRWLGQGADDLPPAARRWALTVTEQREAEALMLLTVIRDEPQRARLIRLSPAQKRVAQLVGTGLTIPKNAAHELQPVLMGLGAHFQVHADDVQASREVTSDSRLRAELRPEGDGVHLRLVVAPFGTEGPRLNPGSGRTRLIAAIQGETVGVQRDPEAERSHLETVLDACPMLTPVAPSAPAAWQIDSPDEALALLERLNTLNAIAALDWPKGKPIHIESVGMGALTVSVRSQAEWLGLAGGVVVDETLVCTLTKLLDWGASTQSRFMPLGEGRYLALTDELRARLSDLASVAEQSAAAEKAGDEARIAPIAAAWLDSTLAGADVQGDAGFKERVERLLQAQQTTWVVPPTLQASLRPYQEEGYVWAMRLADSGLGACLADDMGLGKTLQALAVLLARAAGGPALIVAPTSLMGNWLDEARRFAPSLNPVVFAESDRETLLDQVGPQDLVLVSYQLQQMHAEAFGKKQWHTLVLDEAQAIKNASAKRTQAAFELNADFRLALSGTPIENRLAELWSIMRVCNPGLLGSLALFNMRFAVPIERDRDRGAQRTLRRLIGPFILRRTKAQVLDDLPPRTELTLTIEASATERAHYEALRRQAVIDAQRAMNGAPGQAHLNILAQLTKLRRAACDPRLVTPDLTQAGAKVTAFAELAAELTANGHKTLVFSQFVDFLALLREPLDAMGIKYQYLDGSTPGTERTRRVAAFQAGEGDLFFISLKAGGFGLNLTVADYVVIADPWWNPAAEDQASGRAHRIGQQRPVTVYRLVNKGTLEEKIVALHQDKRELADSVLEGAEVASIMRADELVALMQGD